MVEGRVRPAVRMLVSPAVDTRRTFRRGKSSRIVIMMTIQKSLREIWPLWPSLQILVFHLMSEVWEKSGVLGCYTHFG